MRRTSLRVGLSALALASASAVALAGCAGPAATPDAPVEDITQAEIDEAMTTPTTLTMWNWVPDIEDEIALFEEAYPAITVEYANAGQGLEEYTKLRTAITAGEAPDVAQIEYQYIPSFRSELLDLAPYGASDIADDYVDSVWGQVAADDAVFGIPTDFGPMGNLYRSDILAEAGVEAPTTWDEYAEAARTIKETTGAYISNLPPNEAGQFVGLLWQAGARPFGFDGDKTVTVAIDSPEARAVAEYWTGLLSEDLVDNSTGFTNEWYQAFANGTYAGWLGAAWGPVFLQGTVADTAGLWTASPLPQESADAAPASGFWGGSSLAVMKGSENPIAASQLAMFINHDPESSLLLATAQSQFPPLRATLDDPAFVDQESEFFGGQKVNALFKDIADTVDPEFGWLPYMDFTYSSYNETVGKAIADGTDLVAGLEAWQKAVADYGTEQGFTVVTD